MTFSVREMPFEYDQSLRRSWQEDGTWPHSNHYGFNEAVVAARYIMLGYDVVRNYASTSLEARGGVSQRYTEIVHEVVGPEVSAFFCNELAAVCPNGSGAPDLFVFRGEYPRDPKMQYSDPLSWFFVEVKGPGDTVQDTQKRFWREIATRTEIGLGPDRIRLARTFPVGEPVDLQTVEY